MTAWRPEPLIDEEGLRRRRDTIWLTNDDGASLQVDEDDVARLINAAFWVVDAEREDEGGEWDASHDELREAVEVWRA